MVQDNVDIENTSDSSGVYHVGWVAKGEWLAYNLNVPTAGTYTFGFRYSTPYTGKKTHVTMDGVDITGADCVACHGLVR